MLGTLVSWFNPRSYGFIRPDSPVAGLPVEIFAHISDMPNRQPLPKDTRVSFEIGTFGGRTKAINIVEVRR
jgi:cold shock CspA family protein